MGVVSPHHCRNQEPVFGCLLSTFYSLSIHFSHPSQHPALFRDPNSDQGWGNTTPNQSKSFRILQKITDTIDFLDKEADLYSPEPPQFARQMDFNEQQLRRMQLNDQDMTFTNGHEGKYGFAIFTHNWWPFMCSKEFIG